MKLFILIIALWSFSQGVFSQQVKPSTRLHFTSLNQLGLLLADGGESFTFQSVNGVRHGDWMAGVGTGFDFYGQRSVPLFIDVRRQFFKTFNKPFVYADAGVHFQWLNFVQKEQRGFPDAQPGAFYEAGVGYNFYTRRQSAFVLSAGYGYKRISETFTSYRFVPTNMLSESKDQRISEYRRWVIKFGFRI